MIRIFEHVMGQWDPATGKHLQEVNLFRMPGGEWHVNCDTALRGDYAAVVTGASADDLIGLSILADAVHRDGGTLSAGIPYLPGARQDRRYLGEALSARVYADLINRCGLETVVTVDPHSDVMVSHLDRVAVLDLPTIVRATLSMFRPDGVIIPDAGAVKRAQSVAQALKVPTYQALKKRDTTTGKLSGFTCEPLPDTGHFLVVDDICDGGGTFKGLADAIGVGRDRLSLWVTHGVFSAGSETLGMYYDRIFTTNSHPGGWGVQPTTITLDLTPRLLDAIPTKDHS